MKKKIKLYWVSDGYHNGTDIGDEDWFVFAPSKSSAQKFYEDYEGMERGDSEAELIDSTSLCHKIGTLRIKDAKEKHFAHAQIEDLKQLGFTVISNGEFDSMRVVKRNGVTYTEGRLESVVQQKRKSINPNSVNLREGNN